MGFIDNDNQIITVDSILTEVGRELLARNDGSFEIVRYAFGDDEVDYALFTPNTGSLQQDLNIVNLPIFEANVNEKIALKHQLITISNPDLKYLPTLEANVASLTVKEKADAQVGKSLEFKQAMFGGRVVPSEIVDGSFIVQLDNDLLFIERQTPTNITPNGVSQYVLPRTAIGVDQGAQIRFNIAVQALTNDIWTTLGTGTAPSRTIAVKVRCQGTLSGLLKEVDVTINEEFVR